MKEDEDKAAAEEAPASEAAADQNRRGEMKADRLN